MQINAASLLAAQQARSPAQAAPRASAEDLFEPLFGKAEMKAAPTAEPVRAADTKPQIFVRPGSQIDIRV